MVRRPSMKQSILSYAAVAALGFLLTGCQITQPNRFDKADVNHNGALSRDEINSYVVTGFFDHLDANHDNKMTPTELGAAHDPAQAKAFRDRDANHDGVVSLDEALAYGRKHGTADKFIRKADANKDGSISREEMTAYYASKEGSVR
jgi:Ca2+-binding EF-hand superfamily protein